MGEHSIRRLKPVEGGRHNRVDLFLSDGEKAAIRRKAQDNGVTVQRYLIESALGAPVINNKTVMRELAGIRRIVTGKTTNINQIAHAANVGGHPEPEELEAIRLAIEEQNDLLRRFE